MDYRTEQDSLGSKQVPINAYYGIHTARALENFSSGTRRVPLCLIYALAMVKRAAAEANRDLGYLPPDIAGAISTACDDVSAGKLDGEFMLNAFQGGAGTSTNMNVNEVLANRALEISGQPKGAYGVIHPLDHVNKHQSTNDVYPTALKVALIGQFRGLAEAVAGVQGALQRKEKEFAGVVKIGRTELQEAVPMTLGAEFSAWAEAVSRDRWRTFKCEERLRVVNLGGTAIGTGLGAPREYIFLVIEKLRAITGLGLARGENPVGETANADVLVEVSGILKAHAVNLLKLSNDLRLLNELGEIRLPSLQAGSSLMPGKVNPVLCEAAAQAGLLVIANDMLVTEAASRGTLQIIEFLPLLATALIESLEILKDIDIKLAVHIGGIKADEAKCRYYFDRSPTLVTAFVPYVGYDRCVAMLKEFEALPQENLNDFLVEKLGREEVEKVLAPHNLVGLGYRK
ncbi:MAG: aspartate ammonia-lyase [Candidatus Omnitrophica bacterium]|nr:aspartate ammonia-lyase [Candidatus Omnitrophota bacterium]